MPATTTRRPRITAAATKRRRTRAPKQITHAILYRGPSLIDRSPIVVVAVYRTRGANAKTGAMVQTYIIPDIMGLGIMEIVRRGLDAAVCGGCVHRYQYDGNGLAIAGTRTCYVNLGQGVRSVLGRVQRGGYQDISADTDLIASVGRGRMVRLGTWGDPAAVPVTVWHSLIANATGHTGYTHQWRSARLAAPIRSIVMASCETDDDVGRATAQGFRGTFRVLPVGEAPAAAALCPASAEAGKVATCADCGRCDGRGGDVAIVAHGSMAGRYTGRRALPVLPMAA